MCGPWSADRDGPGSWRCCRRGRAPVGRARRDRARCLRTACAVYRFCFWSNHPLTSSGILSSRSLMPPRSMMKHRGDAFVAFSKCLQLRHSRMSRRGEGAACAIFCAQIAQPNRVFSMVLMPVWTAISSAKCLQSRQYVPAGPPPLKSAMPGTATRWSSPSGVNRMCSPVPRLGARLCHSPLSSHPAGHPISWSQCYWSSRSPSGWECGGGNLAT